MQRGPPTQTGVAATFQTGGEKFGPGSGFHGAALFDPGTTTATINLNGVTITGAAGTQSFTIYVKIDGSSGVGPTKGLTVTWNNGGSMVIVDNPSGTVLGSGATTGTTGNISITYSRQTVTVNWFGKVINATIPNRNATIQLTNFGFGPDGNFGTTNTNTMVFTVSSLTVTTP